ncbi:MAG: energy transducer TonB, partial [Deltaproteobacteria bacterium]
QDATGEAPSEHAPPRGDEADAVATGEAAETEKPTATAPSNAGGPTPPVVEAPPEEADAAERPAGDARIEGTVLRAGDRTPVAGAQVAVAPAPQGSRPGRVRKKSYAPREDPPWEVVVTTAPDGTFAVPDLPAGLYEVSILSPGFETATYVERIEAASKLSVRYYLVPLPSNPYRTVVRERGSEREEVARRRISVEEIDNLPGTQGDALKALQNFPGLARSPFGSGLLLVRGAAPDDSAVFLGYHEIPQLFHFGGLTSVFNSDILSGIDFIPGNFDPRYGDATGGVVNVEPRAGRRDGYHGYIDSDLFDTGALFEGPVGKGSFVLSARRSYIDLLLPLVIPDDAGLDATIAPRYWDYQALFDYPVDGGNLSVRVFGSDDRTKLVFAGENDDPEDDRNRFETTTLFHRADLVYRRKLGGWSFLVTPSYRYDFSSTAAVGIFRFKLAAHTFSLRSEIERWVSKRFAVRFGTEIATGQATIDAEAPPVPTDGEGSSDTTIATVQKIPFASLALYSTWTIRPVPRLWIYPGVRLQLYDQPDVRATVDPRLRMAVDVADRTTLKAGVGIYSQLPSVVEWNPRWGNPRVAPERSLHTSLGVAQRLPYGMDLEVTGFFKYLWDLAAPSDRLVLRPDGTFGPESFASTGVGRIYGAELLFRKNLTKNLFGWLAYTILRSERRDTPDAPWTLADFDQTHILTLVAVYKLPKHWQVGARFRLVSGNPTTPVVGAVYDADSGSYIPLQGKENSDRLPPFHQLDLRVDKRWIFRKLMVNAYLDIQNVYNRQNPEFVNYSFDYREKSFIPSLPIIPSIGLKLEF